VARPRTLVDPEFDRIDTLPHFRKAIARAGLEEEVIGVVGRAPTVAAHWRTPLSLLFIDGGHADEHVINDYEGFARWVAAGGRPGLPRHLRAPRGRRPGPVAGLPTSPGQR
jgi:hypothetical protein